MNIHEYYFMNGEVKVRGEGKENASTGRYMEERQRD